MALITLLNSHLSFGHVALLDGADFSLESNERLGLIGRNGSGKSSLLRILAGLEHADDGELQIQQGLRTAYVAQEPLLDEGSTIFDVVSVGLAPVIALREQFAHAESQHTLDALQSRIEALDGWNWEQRVAEVLQRLRLPSDLRVSTLSGGTRKRVALAQALVMQPDVLLLDEPTNHLDMSAIMWLEDLLNAFKGSVVTISHDRSFLDAVTTRIVELDRGKLYSYTGNFARYQQQKQERLEQEAAANSRADKLLEQEEVWIRKGVEARRTRAQGRINRLNDLRAQRAIRRDVTGQVQLNVAQGLPSGKIVAELTNVSKAFHTKIVVQDFSATILRGDKVGLIGANGAGKTTLLQLILNSLVPDSGTVRQGSNLQIAYFDQMRNALDLDATLEDFISPGSEWIEIDKSRQHVKSYLGKFLFSPARAASPVRSLSGGERNRLLLARLFASPANVLVLDEPTNDLDIDTLELLEDLLQSYAGTVFLVSHDRTFLNNVVTSTIVHEGDGRWREYKGDVQDWITQAQRSAQIQEAAKPEALPSNPAPRSTAPAEQQPGLKRKLSYKEQRELDALPQQIDALEQEQNAIRAQLADGQLYISDLQRAIALQQRDGEIEEALLAALERWEHLGT